MRKREVASFAIFSGAVATLAYAMVGSVQRDAPGSVACDTRIFYPLVPGRPLEFIVTPDVRQFMLASLAGHHGRLLDRHPVTYGVDVEWRDPDDVAVEKRTFYERSWFAPEQDSPPALTPVSPRLLDDAARLADERYTYFPANLQAGGTLRLTARPGDGLVLVRLYYAVETTELEEGQDSGLGGGQPELQGAPVRVAWEESEGAGVRLKRSRWFSASIRGNRGDDFETRPVQLCENPVPFHDRPALTLTLAPGRATAVNLNQATGLLLSGDAGIQDLSAELVADRPAPAAVNETLVPTPAAPLAGLGFAAGAFLEVPARNPTSVILRNSGRRPVSFVANVEAPATSGFFGSPALVPLRDLGARFAASEAVLVGPELRYLEMHRIGPDDPEPLRYAVASFGKGDPIRLRVRALARQPLGEVEREISVTLLDASNGPLLRSTRLVSLPVSPFERALATPWPASESSQPPGWLTDDGLLYVTNHPRASTLEVRADRAVLVSAAAEGLERGDARLYPLRHGTARVRFGEEPVTMWHRLEPANAEQLRWNQTMRVEAVVRLEEAGPAVSPGTNGGPSYALLEPESQSRREAARLYLVRENRVRRQSINYYCSFEAGADQEYRLDTTAWERGGGLISSVLWAPGAALGSPFRAYLDDRLWLAGVLRARVTTGRRAVSGTAERLTLASEPGVRLWLQAYGRQWPCRAPHRVVKAFPLAAGASASFAWHQGGATQGLLLTGFSKDAATLRARIDDGRPRYRVGVHDTATPASWSTYLAASGETTQQLVSPDTSLRRLSVDVRRVGDDIWPGEHRLTVRNLSPQSVDLRVLLQTGDSLSRERDRPQWVRRDAFDEVW